MLNYNILNAIQILPWLVAFRFKHRLSRKSPQLVLEMFFKMPRFD